MDTKAIARRIAEEAIVLLKNEDYVLPFKKGQRAAFFGRAQIDTIYSGNGSGASHTSGCKNILQACEEAGIYAEPGLKAFYRQKMCEEKVTDSDLFDWSNPKEAINSGIMYEIFGQYHIPAWMKQDASYYFMETAQGNMIESVSPFCEAAVDRDCNAFTALMTHLKEIDEERTVIMIQVENEIGVWEIPGIMGKQPRICL